MRVACLWIPEFSKPQHRANHPSTTKNPERNSKALQSLAESCLRFSPMIAIGADCLFIEIGKCKKLYSENSFRARAQALLKKLEISGKVGIANDLPTAKAFAVYNKLSTKEKNKNSNPKPNSNHTQSPIDLPLEALQIFLDPYGAVHSCDPSMKNKIEILQQLGIKNISQFIEIPQQQLAARLGKEMLQIHQTLQHCIDNAATIPWRPFAPTEKFAEIHTFYPDQCIQSLDPLLFTCKKMLDQVFLRLHGIGKQIAALEIEIQQESSSITQNQNQRCSIQFPFPQNSTMAIAPILRDRLDHELQRNPLKLPVTQVSIEITELAPARGRQQDFFSKREQEELELQSLLSRISSRIGFENIFYALPAESYIPERSWKKSLQGELFSSGDLGIISNASHEISDRPLRLLRQPMPLRRIENVFQLLRPQTTRKKISTSRPKQWKAVCIHGPERIDGEWWNEPWAEHRNQSEHELNDHSREYFKIQSSKNEWIWVFRDQNQNYFLHGIFD